MLAMTLFSDDLGIAKKSLGNELRVLDDVAGVRDDAGDQDLAGRQPNRLPYMVLVSCRAFAPSKE